MSVTTSLRKTVSYISFLSHSHTKYGVHSPFVYELITKVLQDRHYYPEYKLAEEIRQQCLHNKRVIEITKYGSEKSRYSSGNELKPVSAIAGSAIKQRSGRLLFRLVKYLAPENLLELGTSLGISTLYMASAAPKANFITMEGCSTSAELAKENFTRSGLPHIGQLIGNFSYLLPRFVSVQKNIGVAFFDGNFTYTSLLGYFKQCLPLCDVNSVLIFNDIHVTQGMENAWKQICKHPRVTVSIDLFELGLVFFRKGLSKQDFTIRF